MKTIEAKKVMSDEAAEALAGTLLGPDAYDVLLRDTGTILKPDGSPLVIYRKDAIPLDTCKAAWRALRDAAAQSFNRGLAAGEAKPEQVKRKFRGNGDTRFRPFKQDGTVSNTSYAVPVNSGIVGFYDRYQRIPYCRMTAFNLHSPEKFAAAHPFIRAASDVFKAEAPERYAAQVAMIEATSDDFYIAGTAFTTVTVNKNWQTAVHQDKGDYRPGFGVMSVLQAGRYSGGHLVFPQYRVAVDMRTRGVCLADVHEWHGNTPLVGVEGRYERVSCVFYYRENMHRCGSAAQELERAKNRKPGQPLWD